MSSGGRAGAASGSRGPRARPLARLGLASLALLCGGAPLAWLGCQAGREAPRRALLAAGAALLAEPQAARALSSREAERLEAESRSMEGVLLPSGIRVIDVLAGDGPEPSEGQRIYVHFKFWEGGFDDGMPVDTTFFEGRPEDFVLGQPAGRIFPGLDAGVRGMREKGWRRLVVPAELGFGAAGLPKNPLSHKGLEPGSTLYVDVHLIDGGSGRCERMFRDGKRKKSLSCEYTRW